LPADTAVDLDRTASTLGPFGSGLKDGHTQAFVSNGKCARDGTYFSDFEVGQLGGCALRAFDNQVEGQFLWTFRNELEDKWSYVNAYDKGWLNVNNSYPSTSFLQ